MRVLDDPRDREPARLVAWASVLLVTAAALHLRFSWWLSALHLALFLGMLERFVTMFHDAHHKPFFKKSWAVLNHHLFWVLATLFGSTPESYRAHHIFMHHPEENLAGDLSSTMPYRRDSPLDFARYYLRFFFCGFSLLGYLRRRRLHRMHRRMAAGQLFWWLVFFVSCSVDVRAALVVLVLPLVAMRSVLIVGNWGEHAFVDPANPECRITSSTNLIGAQENARAFNVGYHIGHHLAPGRHFSEMPELYERGLADYARHDALVFRGLNYPGLWWLLMTGNYEALCDAWVPLPGAPTQTREQALALMQRRVERIAVGSSATAVLTFAAP